MNEENDEEVIYKKQEGSLFMSKNNTNTSTGREYKSHGNHLCDICGMSFTSAMGIRDHRAMHHGTPRYVCALCGKGYMSRTLYRSHVLGHTKEKQFNCEDCHKIFTHKKDLTVHCRIKHGDSVQLHKCEDCDASYVYEQSLRRHRDSKHNGKGFACNTCHTILASAFTLRRHKRTVHSTLGDNHVA